MAERFGIERPTLAERVDPHSAAEIGHAIFKLNTGLDVVSGHALVRKYRGEIGARDLPRINDRHREDARATGVVRRHISGRRSRRDRGIGDPRTWLPREIQNWQSGAS